MMLCVTPAATPLNVRQPEPPKTKQMQVSVKDIYGAIEVERLKSRQECHARVLRALSTANREGSLLSEAEGLSLPSLSRPPTAKSRPQTNMSIAPSTISMPGYPRSEVLQVATGSEFGDMMTPRSVLRGHSAPIIPGRGPCVRARSAVEREMENVVSSLSRQCCDVLGPRICNECHKINRRTDGNYRFEAHYPNLHISEENYTTTVLAQKRYPKLSKYQVSNKVARGEIFRGSLKKSFERRKKQRDEDDRESAYRAGEAADDAKALVVRKKPAVTFFTNIRDLNAKIVAGKVCKKLKQGEDPAKKPAHKAMSASTKAKLETFTEKVCPTFVSPRKVKEEKRPSYIMYYDPPLLPKVCQNAEPAFFAGSENAYKLPDRLPDKLVPEEIDVQGESRPHSAVTSASGGSDL